MGQTVKLKAANDNSIQSCMRTIANRLPDLDIYYQIFADDVLATMLSNAYTEIIVFVKKATVYFQGHGIGMFDVSNNVSHVQHWLTRAVFQSGSSRELPIHRASKTKKTVWAKHLGRYAFAAMPSSRSGSINSLRITKVSQRNVTVQHLLVRQWLIGFCVETKTCSRR